MANCQCWRKPRPPYPEWKKQREQQREEWYQQELEAWRKRIKDAMNK